MSPDHRIITVVGDHTDGLLVDSQSGKVKKVLLMIMDCVFFCISQLQGHCFWEDGWNGWFQLQYL